MINSPSDSGLCATGSPRQIGVRIFLMYIRPLEYALSANKYILTVTVTLDISVRRVRTRMSAILSGRTLAGHAFFCIRLPSEKTERILLMNSFSPSSARCRQLPRASPLCRQGIGDCRELLHFVGNVSIYNDGFSTSSGRCRSMTTASPLRRQGVDR